MKFIVKQINGKMPTLFSSKYYTECVNYLESIGYNFIHCNEMKHSGGYFSRISYINEITISEIAIICKED